MATRLGKGFSVAGDRKMVATRKGRKVSVSERIRQRKSKRTKVVSRSKAMARGQRP